MMLRWTPLIPRRAGSSRPCFWSRIMFIPGARQLRKCGFIFALFGFECELTMPSTSRASGYTFTTISDSNAPDLVTLGQRKINDSGEVAFEASPSFASYRIYKGSGGSLTEIANNAWWGINWPGNGAIDNTGYVTFRGGIFGDKVGIYRGNGGTQTPIAVGDQSNGTAGIKTYFWEISTSGSGNNTVWRQTTQVCTGPSICGPTTDGYFAIISGNSTGIAQQDATWSSIPTQVPVINDAGQVAFSAKSTSDNKTHLARYNAGNVVTIDSDFTGGAGYWMNNAGDVIFAEAGAVSLFHNGSTTTVASTADGFSSLIPSGGGQAFINNSGQIAFWADVSQYNGNPVTWEGVYTGPNIANDRVLVRGDTVLGHTVQTVNLLGLNNSGQMVLSVFAQSPDTWQALLVATPPTGDYNGDHIVDAGDYVVWRKTGINGQPGYNTWRSHFGQTAGSGTASLLSSPVPEPTMLALGLSSSVVLCLPLRRRK
jgi:hypothetical protein